MTSPDGLHWTHSAEPIVHFHPRQGTNDLGPIGDAQALMIDTLRRRYVALLRAIPHRKMSVSTDFIDWSAPRLCLKARGEEESNAIYNHVGFVYGDRYLGFLTYFILPSRPQEAKFLTAEEKEWIQSELGREERKSWSSANTPCSRLWQAAGCGTWPLFILG